MPRRAFVLAAGLGTRLRPFTSRVPKPLFHILGVPLLEIIFEQLKQAGFEEIGLNLHHLSSQIADFVASYARKTPAFSFRLFYEEEILGPVGAIYGAREFFASGPVLVINADILTNFSLKVLLEAHERYGGAATLLLHHYPPYNKVLLEGERIAGFEEGRGFAYTGLQVVTPELVAALKPGERDLIPAYTRLLQEGIPLCGLVGAGFYWRDIGTLSSYLAAHEDLLKGRAVIPPLSPPSSPHVIQGARVGKGVIFEDWVCLEPEVEVASGAKLRRVVAWRGAKIPAGLHEEKLFLPEDL